VPHRGFRHGPWNWGGYRVYSPASPICHAGQVMDCSTFRGNHASFVDGMAGDEELVAMQRHVAECPDCARHDATIRRALLLFRNMPPIEPSAEFAERLRTRLRAARDERRRERRPWRAGFGGPGIATFAALAAGVIAAGFVAVSALDGNTATPMLALAPMIVAAAPPPVAAARRSIVPGGIAVLVDDSLPLGEANAWAPLASPAFAASMSTGMPVWPAAVLAAHAPQLKLTNLER
jgi:hypothetical protein